MRLPLLLLLLLLLPLNDDDVRVAARRTHRIHSHIHSPFARTPLRAIDSIESGQLFEWHVVKSEAAGLAAVEAAGRYTRTLLYASYMLVLWPYK